MPLTIDIRNSGLYQEGMAEGKAKGMAEGKAEGKAESMHEVACRMLLDGNFSIDQIAMVTCLTIDRIEAIEKELN